MAGRKSSYICQECGYKSGKWMGRCPNCGSWNSLQEKDEEQTKNENLEIRVEPDSITKVKAGVRRRTPSGINELDRVLGGGIVNGSLVLLGGAPGVGKSTLILQVASLFSKRFGKVLYVSGEESAAQLKLRAERLQALEPELYVLAETEFDQINAVLTRESYQLVVVDSIQTIFDPRLDSSPGSVAQVREITNRLFRIAKTSGVPIFIIGHVTKEGDLAGPKVLEHLVDTVLQFEGDRNYSYRILRSTKNRFGSSNEVGVFEMGSSGMREVSNPSRLFLEERPEDASGSVIVPVLEGSRPLLVEVQSLVAPATFGTPQRLTTGVDNRRVSILLAVLEKKAGFKFQSQDVNINITGGLRVEEPAIDLGLVTAVISSYLDEVLPARLAVTGEVGLAGEIRAVGSIERRLSELKKLGFKEVIIPRGNMKGLKFDPEINLVGVRNIHELLKRIAG